MKFTIVLPSDESFDLSIGAIFVPCLVWAIGNNHLLNPHPRVPNYIPGDFQNLLDKISVKPYFFNKNKYLNFKVHIVVHDTGNGTENDLRDLIIDVEKSGFIPIKC
jgi:hypothetical protein